MMAIEEDIYTLLTASTAVSSLVSTRIRPSMADQVDWTDPFIVYERTDTTYPVHLGGGTNVEAVRMQFDCVARSKPSAEQVASALYDRLHGKTGTVGNSKVFSIYCAERRSDAIPPVEGSRLPTYISRVVVDAWYKSTTPSSL